MKKVITTWAEADSANRKTNLKDRKRFTSTRKAEYGNFGNDYKNHVDIGNGCRMITNRKFSQ